MRVRRRFLAAGCVLAVLSWWSVVAAPAQAVVSGCRSQGTTSDFNGDSYPDTVIGDPSATVAGATQAGRVTVLYGLDDANGTVGGGDSTPIDQNSPGVSDGAEPGDHFGAALAVADIDCDGYTDLVVGVPGEDVGGHVDAGLVQLIWGSAAGLGAGRASVGIEQATFGLAAHAGDRLGSAVDALADVGAGGAADAAESEVVVGIPGYDTGGHADAGAIGLLAAAGSQLTGSSASQDTTGVPGAAEAGDHFGAVVALNFLGGDGDVVDAVVGAPGEDVGSRRDAGAVTVLDDVYGGAVNGGIALDQDTAGVPGKAETGDHFGASLATSRVLDQTRLAVGVPGEGIGSTKAAGAVQLFATTGARLVPGVSLSQDTPGVSGAAETGDAFGSQVVLDPRVAPDGRTDQTQLAVSAPTEDGAAVDTGLVQVFPVDDLSAEVDYTQDTLTSGGKAQAHDRFGSSLAVVDSPTLPELLVGVPDDATHTTGMVHWIDTAPGARLDGYWAPGRNGVPASGANRFGAALAGFHR